MFINVGRGSIVKEDVLVSAIKRGDLGGPSKILTVALVYLPIRLREVVVRRMACVERAN